MINFVRAIVVLFVVLFSASAQATPFEIYPVQTAGTPTGYATLADGTSRWTVTDTSLGSPRAFVVQRSKDGIVTALDLGSVSPTASSYAAVALSENGEFVALGVTEAGRPNAYSVRLSSSGALGIVGETKAEGLPSSLSTAVLGINNRGEFVGGSGTIPAKFSSLGVATQLATPEGSGLPRGISSDGKNIVGSWTDSLQTGHAAVWNDGLFVDFGFGAFESELFGVSSNGLYGAGQRDGLLTAWNISTGTYSTLGDFGYFKSCTAGGLCYGVAFDEMGNEIPVIWKEGWSSAQNLNTYLAGLGYVLPSPILAIAGITDKGAVLDIGYHGSIGAALNVPDPTETDAQPVSEPSSSAMLLMGVLSAVGVARRRVCWA